MMRGPVAASGRDLRTLAGILSDDRSDPPAEGLAPSLLSDLLGLVGGDHVVFSGTDKSRRADWLGQNIYRLLKVSSRTAAVTRAFADRTGRPVNARHPGCSPPARRAAARGCS